MTEKHFRPFDTVILATIAPVAALLVVNSLRQLLLVPSDDTFHELVFHRLIFPAAALSQCGVAAALLVTRALAYRTRVKDKYAAPSLSICLLLTYGSLIAGIVAVELRDYVAVLFVWPVLIILVVLCLATSIWPKRPSSVGPAGRTQTPRAS